MQEKNWAPCPNQNELLLFYQFSPPQMLRSRLSGSGRVSEQPTARLKGGRWSGSWSGSSALMPFKNGYICVLHRHHASLREYSHMLVYFNRAFEIEARSKPFRFDGQPVEFCAGLTISQTDVVFSYGVMDKEAVLLRVPRSIVNDLLCLKAKGAFLDDVKGILRPEIVDDMDIALAGHNETIYSLKHKIAELTDEIGQLQKSSASLRLSELASGAGRNRILGLISPVWRERQLLYLIMKCFIFIDRLIKTSKWHLVKISAWFRDVRCRQLIVRSGMFNESWYLHHNPDVANSKIDPLSHYLRFGAYEGRDPGPDFDSDWYTSCNPDVASAGVNPLVHYLTVGRFEGRLPTRRIPADRV
jgi:hypothetical protein